MSILKDLKLSHQKKNTQFILIDNKGKVLESDSTLFKVQALSQISDIHPFFLSIDTTTNNQFTCVHLDIMSAHLICDVQLKQVDNNTLIILSDFSKHYNSFQSLAQSRNEGAISSELVQLNNQLLIEKESFKNTFIANFGHEIISPIMSIMTFTNVLSKTNISKEQQDYINVINNSAYHLKAMINDVLDLSKIETGNLEIINKRFSLKKLIRAIETEYRFRCKQKGLSFKINYDDYMPNYIVSDKTRIEQVINNLLDNAIKYTEKGIISLEILKIYRHARNITFSIIVKDSGSGIDKQDQQLIFERFTRLENAKQSNGVGLGLTIVKEIIALNNGSITVESELNKGTILTLNIKTRTPLNNITERKNKVEKQITSSNYKILLVENNITDQLSIFKILANNKDFYLDIADNGQDAIKLVKANSYDLLLVDYNMPKLDGLKTSKAINKIDKNTPIVLITGSYINENLRQFEGKYFKRILNKPFDEETLINSIYMNLK